MPGMFQLPSANAPVMPDSGQQAFINANQNYVNRNDQRVNALSQRLSGTPSAIPNGPPASVIATQQNREALRQNALNTNRQKLGLPAIYNPGQIGPGFQPTNPPGQAGVGQVGTGITAGIMPPEIVAAAQRRLGIDAAPGVPISPGQNAEMQTQFQDMTRQQNTAASTDLDRLASFEGGRLKLAGEKAQAGAGLDWMNLLARLNEMELQRQGSLEQAQFGLIGV